MILVFTYILNGIESSTLFLVWSLSQSNSLQPHGLQHARPSCLSLSPGVYSNSCSLSPWCHPTISSSVTTFLCCPQSLPAAHIFLMKLREFCSLSRILKGFIKNECWIWISFPAPFWMILLFVFSILYIWQVALINFRMLNQSCIPGIYTNWLSRFISFSLLHIYAWIWFASIVFKNIVFMFMRNTGLLISFESLYLLVSKHKISFERISFPLFSKFLSYFFFK